MTRRGLMRRVAWLLAGMGLAAFMCGSALVTRPDSYPIGVQAAASGQGSSSPNIRLYVGSLSSWKLNQVDPVRLVALRHGRFIALRNRHLSDLATVVLSSRNGSILVADSVQRASHIIRIINGRTGAIRSQFGSTVPTSLFAVTADGSKLVGYRTPYGGAWDVLSGKNGRLLHSIPDVQATDGLAFLDPTGHFLYALHATWGIDQKAPTTPTLVAYNLTTGQEVGRVPMTGVLAGSWNSGRTIQGDPIVTDWEPGLAISPDGRQIAVLDGHSGTLTLVDARTLTVERSVTPSEPTNAPERLLSWLGLAPEVAFAKGIEGGMRSIQFSTNGQRLYVTGVDSAVDERGKASNHGIGLQVLDVRSDQTLATSLPGQQVQWLGLTSDGEAVYSLASTAGSSANRYTLRRQNSATLRVTAARTFRQLPEIVVTAD